MTIRRGDAWGVVAVVPPGLAVFDDDAALSSWLNADPTRPAAGTACGLRGGDLWRTLGGNETRATPSPGADATWCPVDLLRLRSGDDTWWVVSHLVARRRTGWRGEVVVVMNAQFRGGADVAPRAHPNDGRADVLRIAPSFGVANRWKALRRSRTGTHVPHPLIEERRVARSTITFERPLDVVSDGIRRGRFDRVDVDVVPDALTVVI